MERASADDFPDEVMNTIPVTSKANAFTELMRPKPKTAPDSTDTRTKHTLFRGRDGLAEYTEHPETFPSSRVIDYDDDFVVIRDLYPKASVHLLILPRDPKMTTLRGQDAFDDVKLLEACRKKEQEVRKIAASELRRLYGKDSTSERLRTEAVQSGESFDDLPEGRDWDKEIKSGVHAIPSMNHLHVHVLSRDMVSPCMKKHNHYLSFNTDFLIPLSAFPLANDDSRRHYGHWQYSDLICWRCGKNCGTGTPGMRVLIPHLATELDEWKKE